MPNMVDYKFNFLRLNTDSTLDADVGIFQGEYQDISVKDYAGKDTIVSMYTRTGKANKEMIRNFVGMRNDLEQVLDNKLRDQYAAYGSPIAEQTA